MNIRAKRIEKNMTQAEIAAQIGVNQIPYLNGKQESVCLRAVMIIQLAKILDCTVDEFIERIENNDNFQNKQ